MEHQRKTMLFENFNFRKSFKIIGLRDNLMFEILFKIPTFTFDNSIFNIFWQFYVATLKFRSNGNDYI